MLAKENFINAFTQQAAARATVLNCTPKVLAVMEERMRTDEETTVLATATKLMTMVNTADDKMSKSMIVLAQRVYTFPS